MQDTTERKDVYSRITAQIVEYLEKGVRPWTRPWNAEHAAGRITRPLRHNGKPYSGLSCRELVIARAHRSAGAGAGVVVKVERTQSAGRNDEHNS